MFFLVLVIKMLIMRESIINIYLYNDMSGQYASM